ncbi:MAG: hypothetical protein KatS3mg077_0265 [Candidatus Binatia bacterium]|nr:MAG: hypothetical protein KatS3mg077_0265 [Candidatus Binatia bacterium]
MFEFAFEPEEELARKTAHAFALEVLRPSARQHEQAGVSAAVARQYRDLGFSTMEVPEHFGGSGQGAVAKCLVLEECGWGDAGATLALENLSWLEPVLQEIPDSDRARLLAAFDADPEQRLAFSDAREHVTEVQPGRLSGNLPFVAARAPNWLLLRTETGLVLLDASLFSCRPLQPAGVEAAGASAVQFDHAVPRWLCTTPATSDRVWAHVRIALAAMLVGVSRAALEYALEYARQRRVFGRPIAQHQAPAFLLADMHTSIAAARLATWFAAKAYDDKDADAPRHAAHAFLEAAEAALFCTREAVQLLGGHGFLRDHPVEKWMRDARILSLLAGGRDGACEDLNRWDQMGFEVAKRSDRAGQEDRR